MKISELNWGAKNIDFIEGEITDIKAIRKITSKKSGTEYRITEAQIRDDSGNVKLNLWDEEGDRIRKGSRIKISNGYVSTFKDVKSLNVGKYGSLDVIQF